LWSAPKRANCRSALLSPKAATKKSATPKVTLELRDYRDIIGSFDRIVSIELVEGVGEAFWPNYFQALHDRLRPGGTVVLQGITIDERRFESYRQSPDFIQRQVFPGGMLPTRSALLREAEKAGLSFFTSEHFGESYARTLAEWRRRFLASRKTVETMGFSEELERMWDYYLSYSEGGFRSGVIDVGLYGFRRSAA
jgi:cyclopropane-fatty-acyl-phospholipid synthase